MAKSIQEQIKENSKNWHTADSATKKELEKANKELNGQLDAENGTSSSLNTSTGKWETSGGGGSSSPSYGSTSKPKDDYYYQMEAQYGKAYSDASASGDAMAMRAANDAMNQIRNQYGLAAEFANDHINQVGGNGGGSFGGASGGSGIGGVAPGYDPMKNWMTEQERLMAERAAAEKAATEAYISQAVNGLNGQKQGVNQSADELARQAYIKNMQSRRTMPQVLSAAGYSGGMADSQKLSLELGLRNEQAGIEQSRGNALNGIDSAINDARLQGSIEGAKQDAARAQAAIDAFNSYSAQKMQLDNANAQNELSRQHDDKWNKANMDNENYQKRYAYVMKLLEDGVMPDDGILSSVNLSTLEAQEIYKQYRAIAAQAKAGKSGGYKSGGGGGLTASQDTPAWNTGYGDIFGVTEESDPDYDPWAGIDKDSVTALGYGMISPEALNRLLERGEVEAYESGGLLRFRRRQGGGLGGAWFT